jgi:hypothetical protein
MKFRPRFSLRTLFVAITVVGVFLAWLVPQLKWIHDRHVFLASYQSIPSISIYKTCRAPSPLWLFGEDGIQNINLAKRYEAKISRLFPEAKITIRGGWERTLESIKDVNSRYPGYYQPSIYDE